MHMAIFAVALGAIVGWHISYPIPKEHLLVPFPGHIG